MRTIAHQIEAMTQLWPSLRLKHSDERSALWRGYVSPTSARSYLIEVSYKTPLLAMMFTNREVQPRVKVLEPLLERHDDYEDGPIPHVYWDKADPQHPLLCLFNPENNEWGVDDLIAKTTIPWALRWLYFYEGWLAIRKWRGGGLHHRADGGKKLASV